MLLHGLPNRSDVYKGSMGYDGGDNRLYARRAPVGGALYDVFFTVVGKVILEDVSSAQQAYLLCVLYFVKYRELHCRSAKVGCSPTGDHVTNGDRHPTRSAADN